MPKEVPIDAVLAKMREVLEMVNRSDQEKRDATLSALQAILQALVNLDNGSAVAVLSSDFKGAMSVHTLNANEETFVVLAQSALAHLGHVRLNDLPVEAMGAVQ